MGSRVTEDLYNFGNITVENSYPELTKSEFIDYLTGLINSKDTKKTLKEIATENLDSTIVDFNGEKRSFSNEQKIDLISAFNDARELLGIRTERSVDEELGETKEGNINSFELEKQEKAFSLAIADLKEKYEDQQSQINVQSEDIATNTGRIVEVEDFSVLSARVTLNNSNAIFTLNDLYSKQGNEIEALRNAFDKYVGSTSNRLKELELGLVSLSEGVSNNILNSDVIKTQINGMKSALGDLGVEEYYLAPLQAGDEGYDQLPVNLDEKNFLDSLQIVDSLNLEIDSVLQGIRKEFISLIENDEINISRNEELIQRGDDYFINLEIYKDNKKAISDMESEYMESGFIEKLFMPSLGEIEELKQQNKQDSVYVEALLDIYINGVEIEESLLEKERDLEFSKNVSDTTRINLELERGLTPEMLKKYEAKRDENGNLFPTNTEGSSIPEKDKGGIE